MLTYRVSHSSMHPSTCLSIHPLSQPSSCHVPTQPSPHPSPIYPPIHPSTHPPICPSTHQSIHQSTHPSTHSSIHPSTHPCMHPKVTKCLLCVRHSLVVGAVERGFQSGTRRRVAMHKVSAGLMLCRKQPVSGWD